MNRDNWFECFSSKCLLNYVFSKSLIIYIMCIWKGINFYWDHSQNHKLRSKLMLHSRKLILVKSLVKPIRENQFLPNVQKKFAKISSLKLYSLWTTTFTFDHVYFWPRSVWATFTIGVYFVWSLQHLGSMFTLDVYFGSILIIAGVKNMQHDRCSFYQRAASFRGCFFILKPIHIIFQSSLEKLRLV